ncbi:MAG: ComF family protein [Clostridiales bacterium]|nr:ComF family protein [Clostridiales bacterium]
MIRRILRGAAELFAPTEFKCLVCGKDVFDQLGFCPDCIKKVVFNNGKTCKRCGVGIDGDEDYCGNCAYDKLYFDRAYSAFNYEGVVQKTILNMKFDNMGSYARVFARYLVYLAQKHNLEYDLVTFVPMSRNSLKKRRYNQAKLLAEHFCALLNQDGLLVEAVVKVKETVTQEQLSKSERKTNLIGAYRANADVKGKRVLVIDDVKTTGATINECAKVLKGVGATEVVAITVASRKEYYSYETD